MHNKRDEIIAQYQEGAIHAIEMVEALLNTVEPKELREYFTVAPVEFANKLGLDQIGTNETRQQDMQKFAARLASLGIALLAETFDGFVPSIYTTSDGKIIIVEQNLHDPHHREDVNYVPTTTHVLDISK